MLHYHNNKFITRALAENENVDICPTWGNISIDLPEGADPSVSGRAPKSVKGVLDAVASVHGMKEAGDVIRMFDSLKVGGVGIHCEPLVDHWPASEVLHFDGSFFLNLAERLNWEVILCKVSSAYHNEESGKEVYFAYRKTAKSKRLALGKIRTLYNK